MFVNVSNHPSSGWSGPQLAAAQALGGEVVDVPFPDVPPECDTDAVRTLGAAILGKIAALYPVAILVQGEFTLAFYLVSELQFMSFRCYAATTRRVSEIEVLPEGPSRRISRFEFVQFRKYCEPANARNRAS